MDEQVRPPTIDGYSEDTLFHDRTPLVARRTGELERGLEVYEAQLPFTKLDFTTGRYAVQFDLVPGASCMRLMFAEAR